MSKEEFLLHLREVPSVFFLKRLLEERKQQFCTSNKKEKTSNLEEVGFSEGDLSLGRAGKVAIQTVRGREDGERHRRRQLRCN